MLRSFSPSCKSNFRAQQYADFLPINCAILHTNGFRGASESSPADTHRLDGQPIPYDGFLTIKLIGATNEIWFEGKFSWIEEG
jgi:hypothetical protein